MAMLSDKANANIWDNRGCVLSGPIIDKVHHLAFDSLGNLGIYMYLCMQLSVYFT